MKYVTYDSAGKLTGAYDQDLRQEHVNNYVEVTDAQYRNWVTLCYKGGAIVAATPAVPDLPTAKANKIAQVESLARTKREGVVVGVSPAEMSSWPIKRDEATKFKASITAAVPAGDPALAPNLNTEATARGVALPALADKVLAKANYLSDLEAKISGNAGKHNDAINALTTVDAVNAYNFSGGWPV